MTADYDIRLSRPSRACGVQFGLDPILLGLTDRLIDDANRLGADVGLIAVDTDTDSVKALREQDGLYSVFVRGEINEERVNREQVVGCILDVLDADDDFDRLMQLAHEDAVGFAILNQDETGENRERDQILCALCARFLAERCRAGKKPIPIILISEDGGKSLMRMMRLAAQDWGDEINSFLFNCTMLPACCDCLTFKASKDERARISETTNYSDEMMHLSEPYGRMIVKHDPVFACEYPIDRSGQVRFSDDVQAYILSKNRVFDAGLFLFGALGILRGNDTLCDCMKDEPLRGMVGKIMLDDLLPKIPIPRAQAIEIVVSSYARYENAMNDNLLTDACRGMIHKFSVSILPALKEMDAVPDGIALALAATILLYADARPGKDGYETVVGDRILPIRDDPEVLEAFSHLSSDMAPDSLAYAALSDRTLWNGEDLREIEGLMDAVIDNMAR